MLRYRPHVPPDVEAVIRHLPTDVKRLVRSAVRALAADPRAGEPLHGELEGLRKFRVRRYRIVYRVLAPLRMIRIVAVGERASVYEQMARQTRADDDL